MALCYPPPITTRAAFTTGPQTTEIPRKRILFINDFTSDFIVDDSSRSKREKNIDSERNKARDGFSRNSFLILLVFLSTIKEAKMRQDERILLSDYHHQRKMLFSRPMRLNVLEMRIRKPQPNSISRMLLSKSSLMILRWQSTIMRIMATTTRSNHLLLIRTDSAPTQSSKMLFATKMTLGQATWAGIIIIT